MVAASTLACHCSRCTAGVYSGLPPEEGEAPAAEDDDELQLAAKPYLPATTTELQLLAADAEHAFLFLFHRIE